MRTVLGDRALNLKSMTEVETLIKSNETKAKATIEEVWRTNLTSGMTARLAGTGNKFS